MNFFSEHRDVHGVEPICAVSRIARLGIGAMPQRPRAGKRSEGWVAGAARRSRCSRIFLITIGSSMLRDHFHRTAAGWATARQEPSGPTKASLRGRPRDPLGEAVREQAVGQVNISW